MSKSATLARQIADKAQGVVARAESLDDIDRMETAEVVMALVEQALIDADEAALRGAHEAISDPRAAQWFAEILDFQSEIVPGRDVESGGTLLSSLMAIPVILVHEREIDGRLDEERRECIEDFLRDEGFLGEAGEVCIEPYLYGREDLEIPAVQRRQWLLRITDGAWGAMSGEPSPEPRNLTCPAPQGRAPSVSMRFVVGAVCSGRDGVDLFEIEEGDVELVDEDLAPLFEEQGIVEARVLPPSRACRSIAPAVETAQMTRVALAARGACEQAREVWAEIHALPGSGEFSVGLNSGDGRVLETLVWRAESSSDMEEAMERLTKLLTLIGVHEVRWPKVPRH